MVYLAYMDMQRCAECGGRLEEGKTCNDYFQQMLIWDFEDFTGAGAVHHLTVLCYHVQHPATYSKKGLEDAKAFLTEFVAKKRFF